MLSDYDKGFFNPAFLVGVETTEGYVKSYWNSYATGRLFINTTKLRNLISDEVEYYISDDSDETVSFTDYVNMFYDGWYNENEIKS